MASITVSRSLGVTSIQSAVMKLRMPIFNTLFYTPEGNGKHRGGSPGQPYTPPSHGERWGFFAIVIGMMSLLAVTLWFSLPRSQSPTPPDVMKPELKLEAKLTHEPILPIPLEVKVDSTKAALGERLFHDPRLSADNSISCATCHNLATNGADDKKVSIGIKGQAGPVNSLTVFNSSHNFALFWDGRARDLKEQVDGPINSPIEMGSSWPEIISKLNQDPDFVADFTEVYADGINASNIKDAIAEFEHSLITPNSRFDRYLRGDKQALTEEELHGYQLFKNYGCIACHQGVNVGGNMFQVLGVMGDYFKDRGNITEADNGRFNVTGKEADRHHFRVPSLRNVAITAPYFHDGATETLEEAVKVMAKYQLGRSIPEQDVAAIVAFLKTLTGEFRGKPL